jgi:hypothetical protein
MSVYTDGLLKPIAIMERPCPMVHGQLVDHGHRNRTTERWQETFRLARQMGFKYLRAGIPWNRVWLDKDRFDWAQLDAEFGYAEELGLTLVPMLAHMSYDWESGWMLGPRGEHALERHELPDIFARYTRLYLERYSPHLGAGFIPIVEVGGEGLNRFLKGLWEPHLKEPFGAAAHERAFFNLVTAFNASAAVAREYEVPVVACEAICLNEPKFTLAALQLDFDVLGVNYYCFANKGRSLTEALTQWREMFLRTRKIDPVFAMFEWGSPEYMDVDNWWMEEPGYRDPTPEHPYPPPCRDINRKKEDELLRLWLQEVKARGIKLSFICRFLVGNFWHYHLTQSSEGMECDRNGIIDVSWNAEKGDYDYRPCWGIARRLHEIVEEYNR